MILTCSMETDVLALVQSNWDSRVISQFSLQIVIQSVEIVEKSQEKHVMTVTFPILINANLTVQALY